MSLSFWLTGVIDIKYIVKTFSRSAMNKRCSNGFIGGTGTATFIVFWTI